MKKTYSIIVLALLLILTGVNLWIMLSGRNECPNQCHSAEQETCYLSKTISLNQEQKEQYNKIKQRYQQRAVLVADSLHISQECLMRELMKQDRDSLAIARIEEKISSCQSMLLHLSVEQYYQIRDILSAEQIPQLDKLFAQILICRPTCNHRDDDAGTIPHLE
ncbi:MAG: hypothetical protein ACI3Z9_03405 [Candidatus Onthomorpha sp.]